MADSLIKSGNAKKILVVGAETLSKIVDWTDRRTCVLFGDGAGAVLLEPNEEGLGIQDAILKSDGSGRDYLNMKGGGSVSPSTHETVDAKDHYIYQDGKTVFKFAVTNMADISEEIMLKNNFSGMYLITFTPTKTATDAGTARKSVIFKLSRFICPAQHLQTIYDLSIQKDTSNIPIIIVGSVKDIENQIHWMTMHKDILSFSAAETKFDYRKDGKLDISFARMDRQARTGGWNLSLIHI